MRIKLGRPLSAREIARAIGGELLCDGSTVFHYISTDSRELEPADLFIALKGKKYDGKDYIDNARKIGARVLSPVDEKSDITHPDTGAALLALASHYVKTLPYLLYNIGITGSVGKTTTKEFLRVILSLRYRTHASEGNHNNKIGMPLSVLSADPHTEAMIMEMGMNSRGEISRLSKCLMPDIALITNVGSAHIGRLGSREEIARAKTEITDGTKDGPTLVPFGEALLSDVKEKKTFSISDPRANFYLKSDNNNRVTIFRNGAEFCRADFALREDYHKECLISAVAIAIEARLFPEEIARGISSISTHNTRQTRFQAENLLFYSDCYNASLESMLAVINEFVLVAPQGKRSLLLGDILESGDMRRDIHHSVGKYISPRSINYLFLFGPNAYEIGEGAIENGFSGDKIKIVSDIGRPDAMAKTIRGLCPEGEHILAKASRGIGLERILNNFRKDSP